MESSSSKDALTANGEAGQGWSKKNIIVCVLSLLLTISICVVAIYYKDYLLDTRYLATYGLTGMLIVAFLGDGSKVRIAGQGSQGYDG
ncbi:hypothetical protein ACFLTN_06730, partial [Chloroflexota bacterium]